MMDKLVSTIIPVFNRPALLRDAVHSVLAQTYHPIEILIVDDGSTDSTPQVIDELVADSPGVVRSIRQRNAGPGPAREAGRIAANGAFLQYLDSDDLLLPRKFELQVAALSRSADGAIAYGKTQFAKVGEAPSPVAHKRTGEKHDFLFPTLLLGRWWSTSTPLYRREAADRIGPWRALLNEEDWEYESRAAAQGLRLVYCDDFVSVTRSHQADQHLCYAGSSEPRKLKDRATAHESILRQALAAGISTQQAEMRHFARDLFLLARQCGAAGLAMQSRRLVELALEASGRNWPRRADIFVYRGVAQVLGWRRAGRISHWIDERRAAP
jgi:glycosyltransferase involved in cell wall biosynthesis